MLAREHSSSDNEIRADVSLRQRRQNYRYCKLRTHNVQVSEISNCIHVPEQWYQTIYKNKPLPDDDTGIDNNLHH